MTDMTEYISTGALVWMALAAILGILLPILFLIFWKRKTKCKLMPALVGAIIFVVFALGLETIPKLIFFVGDSSLPVYVRSHTWAYVLIGCLQAGLFEETGRYVAFRWMLKKHRNKETAVTYGIGHGGIESIILLGVMSLSSISLALMVNSGALSAMTANYTTEQMEALSQTVATLAGYGVLTCAMAVLERILAIILHISLSVVVFASVHEKGKAWLFPAAIALHAVFDVPAALYQCGAFGVVTTEILLAVLVAGIAVLAVRMYRRMASDPERRCD